MHHHAANDNGHFDLTDLDDRCILIHARPAPPAWLIWSVLLALGLVVGSAGYGLVRLVAWLVR